MPDRESGKSASAKQGLQAYHPAPVNLIASEIVLSNRKKSPPFPGGLWFEGGSIP
jgi:hypothetical protein